MATWLGAAIPCLTTPRRSSITFGARISNSKSCKGGFKPAPTRCSCRRHDDGETSDFVLRTLDKEDFMKRSTLTFFLGFLLFIGSFGFSAHAASKVSFPFTPISAASLPWWLAKEARYYEKHGLDVDMIYVGASPVIIQVMLGGQAGVGAGGGPPLVTNVLQGG